MLTILLKVKDDSLTSRLLNPFWTWLASFIPASVAPNVITLAGFICQLLAFWVSDPSIVQWIGNATSAVSAAVFTYLYMTLDALDGKHARNTAQSGAVDGSIRCFFVSNFFAQVQVLLAKFLITLATTSAAPFLL